MKYIKIVKICVLEHVRWSRDRRKYDKERFARKIKNAKDDEAIIL
ncbi:MULTISPECIES: hypothetical protein [Clostridium]|nr:MULTISPECIES: hypothetical protein [Clostridium]